MTNGLAELHRQSLAEIRIGDISGENRLFYLSIADSSGAPVVPLCL